MDKIYRMAFVSSPARIELQEKRLQKKCGKMR